MPRDAFKPARSWQCLKRCMHSEEGIVASGGGFDSVRMHACSGRPAPMTYMHIHEEPTFSLGIFCLPKGNQIPLHNHPGMSVFSRCPLSLPRQSLQCLTLQW